MKRIKVGAFVKRVTLNLINRGQTEQVFMIKPAKVIALVCGRAGPNDTNFAQVFVWVNSAFGVADAVIW